jgi:hypothetical protein
MIYFSLVRHSILLRHVKLENDFDNIVKEGDLEDCWKNAKRWNLDNDLNFEMHHVIPVKSLEINKENILKYRLEFRLIYEEADKSWRDINPFIDFE